MRRCALWWTSPLTCKGEDGKPLRSNPRLLIPGITIVSLLLIFLANWIVIGGQFLVSRMTPETHRPRVLVASSSFICDSVQNKECGTKHWIRRSTFQNWIGSGFEVLIMVDHNHDCEKLPNTVACVKHECWHASMGLPKVGCLIHDSLESHPEYIVVFTNDDISFNGLDDTIRNLNTVFDQFVALGRRTNVPLEYLRGNQTGTPNDATPLIDIHTFPSSSEEFKESDAFELDYFVFKVGASVLDEYPDFLLGNWRWDNMMVDYLLLKNVTIIDVSESVTAYHLGKTATVQDARHGAKYNDDLMGTYQRSTEDSVTDDGKNRHPVVRFGFMDNAHYEMKRGDSGETILVPRLGKPLNSSSH